MFSSDIKVKYQRLINLIRSFDSVIVAYSGGVDSTFLAVVCHNVLGNKARAVTAQSETYPTHELEEAICLAQQFNLPHRIIQTSELNITSFSDNPPNRCYYCKKELFKKLREIADNETVAYVLDGTTLSDEGDYRPGRQAAVDLKVRSPLLEVGLRKEEVRVISRFLGLPTWNKPAYACLASRFPYGEKITEKKLGIVEQAEDWLRILGFKQVRVRYHKPIARIEVAVEEISRLLEPSVRNLIARKFRSLGFLFVTVDLEGYRSGSMNRELEQKEIRELETAEIPEVEAIESEEIIYMTCPRCQDKKLEDAVTKVARFKQCSNCGGVWFNLNELEKALGKGIKFALPEGIKTDKHFSNAFKPICPNCKAQLVNIKSFNFPELGVEACLVCQGRWVDGKEVEKIQNRGFLTQIKNFVMRLF